MKIGNLTEIEAFEKIACMITLDKSENFEKTSEIIKNEIITTLKEDIKLLKLTLVFVDSIKEDSCFISYDHEKEEAYHVSKEESKIFIERLEKAYSVLLEMVENNKKEIENMEF